MGLDQYAYVATRSNERSEFYESEGEFVNGEWVVPGKAKPREIAYWRKHPNLHGWMQKLWEAKGGSGEFNGDELELTWEDIDDLEKAVKKRKLPTTSGFFFGNPSDDHYYDHDLEFIKNARAELFLGLKVFYNSSW
jgi:hypothetical protein